MKKRLVFIYADALNHVSVLEWAPAGNLNMETFDPVAEFERAFEARSMNLDNVSLLYVFYPDGNPGLIQFSEDVINEPGKPYRLSEVTMMQTAAGMLPVVRE